MNALTSGLSRLAIYCADVGSIVNDNFGWARIDHESGAEESDSSIETLAEALINDLLEGRPVSLGFECPLFVPVPEDPFLLGKGREGEGSRSWSAHAGAASMAAGLAQVPWVLARVASGVARPTAYLGWEAFAQQGSGFFLWEAFVSAGAKGCTHEDDALIGARAFRAALPNPAEHNALSVGTDVVSLIGAALVRTGWGDDRALLSTPVIVIRAESSPG